MHEPIVGDHWLKKIGRWFVGICNQLWVKYLIKPIVLVFPPTIITLIATRHEFQQQLTNVVGNKILGFITDSSFIVIVCALIYVEALKGMYAIIEKYSKPEREIGRKDFIAILSALDTVVSAKCKRFSDSLNIYKKDTNENKMGIFFQITCPDQQIALLVQAIQTVFSNLDNNNALFRVGIICIKNNRAESWLAFSPEAHPPRTLASALNVPSSCVQHAIKTKSIIVVQDIQKELAKPTKKERMFVKGNTQPCDQGSQLCFPIVHPNSNTVEYVLSIACNKKNGLLENHKEIYAWLLNHFVLRVILEHNLLLLKDEANKKEGNHVQ